MLYHYIILISLASLCSCITIAPGTSFVYWELAFETPGHRFNCSVPCTVAPRNDRNADIVLFHANELERNNVRTLTPKHHPSQLYIAYSLEPPSCFMPYLHTWFDGQFDYIATVNPESNGLATIPQSQKTMRVLFNHPHVFPDGVSEEFTKQKLRLLKDEGTPWASVMIHNDIEWRLTLLKKTMAVFGPSRIRSMGPVMNNYRIPASQGRFSGSWNEDKRELISNYLFHFAWENGFEPGFVTEKIFDCFVSGTVPIYVGPDDVSELIPCDSFYPCYINYRDFEYDPERLFEYIQYLVHHPAEYMKYFEWRNHPLSAQFMYMYETYLQSNTFCRMCQLYHQNELL